MQVRSHNCSKLHRSSLRRNRVTSRSRQDGTRTHTCSHALSTRDINGCGAKSISGNFATSTSTPACVVFTLVCRWTLNLNLDGGLHDQPHSPAALLTAPDALLLHQSLNRHH